MTVRELLAILNALPVEDADLEVVLLDHDGDLASLFRAETDCVRYYKAPSPGEIGRYVWGKCFRITGTM